MYRGENKSIFWSKLYMISRKVFVYIMLSALSILCLFTLYILLVNASRSNYAIRNGFKGVTGTHFFSNLGKIFDNTKFVNKYNTPVNKNKYNASKSCVGNTLLCIPGNLTPRKEEVSTP